MTATQAVFFKQNWPDPSPLQRVLLARDRVSLAGYRFLGQARVKGVQVLHGRTDKLWLNTIITPTLVVTVHGPVDAVRGEATS